VKPFAVFLVLSWLVLTTSVHAQLYGITDLGTLGGNFSEDQGQSLTDAGTIVGDSLTGSGNDHAFSYSGGVMTDLGTLGGNLSLASGINSTGTIVVGYSKNGGGLYRGFSYSGGVMTALGTLGGNNSYAFGINSVGTIIGQSDITGNTATDGRLQLFGWSDDRSRHSGWNR
jgi:probable HAF family extracellular repeat protein